MQRALLRQHNLLPAYLAGEQSDYDLMTMKQFIKDESLLMKGHMTEKKASVLGSAMASPMPMMSPARLSVTDLSPEKRRTAEAAKSEHMTPNRDL